jgi:3-hydroxyisobutyrate dehydrogenase-like beta-hydroxyacid dehydrogenase
MGAALTERLLACGHRVAVWNRTRAKAEPLIALGAEWSDNPLASCQRVVVSLYTTEVVETVLASLGPAAQPGQIIVDTTTGEPAQAATLGQRLEQRGIPYLSALLSGSSQQALRGEAVIIVGGPEDAFTACAGLWEALGGKVFYVGSCMDAVRMKLVTNLVLGLNRAALAEGLAFAEAVGLETATALGILSKSMAYSKVMDVKGRKMVERDFKVQARLSQHLKDVQLMLKSAGEAGLKLPLSEAHRALLEQAEDAGLGELDNSAIIELFRSARRKV